MFETVDLRRYICELEVGTVGPWGIVLYGERQEEANAGELPL